MNTSALVVSLHDVSPRTQAAFSAMLGELAAWGVARTSLLVIPDHHHRGHMLADAGFCRWLEGLAAQGHELVVHGYYHQRETRAGETWRERFTTRVYTAGEGEFYDLSRDEATARLARAQEDFRQLDAPAPTGFIAPAWLLADAASDAVREAGFRYTTYLTGVQDYATAGQIHPGHNRWFTARATRGGAHAVSRGTQTSPGGYALRRCCGWACTRPITNTQISGGRFVRSSGVSSANASR